MAIMANWVVEVLMVARLVFFSFLKIRINVQKLQYLELRRCISLSWPIGHLWSYILLNFGAFNWLWCTALCLNISMLKIQVCLHTLWLHEESVLWNFAVPTGK
jgi:hypothetical protein